MYIWVEGISSTSIKNRYFDQFPGLFDGFMDDDFLRNADTDSIEFPSIFNGDLFAKSSSQPDTASPNQTLNTSNITSKTTTINPETTDTSTRYETTDASTARYVANAQPADRYPNPIDIFYINNPDSYPRSRNNLEASSVRYDTPTPPRNTNYNLQNAYSPNRSPYYPEASGIIEGDIEDVNDSICMRISMPSLIAFYKSMDEKRRELSVSFLQNGLEYNEFAKYKVIYKNLQKTEAKIERCINCVVAQEKQFSGFWQTAKLIFYQSMTKSARDKLFEKRMEFYVDVFLGSKNLEKMVQMYELIEIHQSLLDKFEGEIIQYAAQHCIKNQLQYEV